MNKFFFILISFLFLISCKKENTIKPASLAGSWKWIYTYEDLPLSSTNPLTPANTEIQESITFNTNNSWKRIQNGIIVDSGTYSIGHGTYTPYIGAAIFTYDSVGFYKQTIFQGWDSYSISNDTLAFNPYLSGRFSSYMLPYNGSKWWVKQ